MKKKHLKKVRIGGVVVCRMKSRRLKKKALLSVGKLSSIEYCIKNILEFDNIHKVILATSDHKDDRILKNHTYNKDVEFFKGDQEDVIKRLIDVAEKYKLDVIVRITGDSPLRSNKMYNKLLNSHFETGADYTAANDVPAGMNIEIINVFSLKRLFSLFNNSTPYSEYLSYYFRNNPDYFKLNLVSFNLPIKSNIRLTIDYKEDLELINVIEKEFNFCENKFDVEKVIDFLEKNEAINKINSHCQKTYSDNSTLLKDININTKLNL